MDPVTIGLALSAVQAIMSAVDQYKAGQITKEQADAYFKQASDHYDAARAAWDMAGPPAAGV